MKAIVQEAYGSPDVLRVGEVDEATPEVSAGTGEFSGLSFLGHDPRCLGIAFRHHSARA